MFGGLLGSDRDIKGEDLFRRYKLVRLKNLTEAELTKKILASLIHDDDAYFARARKNISQDTPMNFAETLMIISMHTFRNVSNALKVSSLTILTVKP